MIGNDVVDLSLARTQSNWKRKGFLDKIFTLSEQILIANAANPDLMVWTLWSRKEAAYKIFNRETSLRLYNPIQFECSKMECQDGFYSGLVLRGEKVYYTESEITTAYIHTIATTKLEDFNKVYNIDDSSDIKKRNHIPFRITANAEREIPVSISHHGKFRKIISI